MGSEQNVPDQHYSSYLRGYVAGTTGQNADGYATASYCLGLYDGKGNAPPLARGYVLRTVSEMLGVEIDGAAKGDE